MTDLRAAVRRRIAELGISQAEAARRGGMHPTRLYDWLAGRRDLYVETLLALLAGLLLEVRLSPVVENPPRRGG